MCYIDGILLLTNLWQWLGKPYVFQWYLIVLHIVQEYIKMQEWLWTTLLLCLYGFLKELRPSEPFITEYLIEPKWVNITLEEVSDTFVDLLWYNSWVIIYKIGIIILSIFFKLILQAYYDVYPVWTYSYLAVLLVVFLLTDWLRYKSVIVFEGFAYIATWCILIFGKGVPLMQVCIRNG